MNNKIIIVVKIRRLSYQKGNTFVIPSFFYFSDCGQRILMCLGQIPLNFHGKIVEGVSGVEISIIKKT